MANQLVKVTSFAITIEAPMHKAISLVNGRDISHWTEVFSGLANREKNVEYRKNYGRCCAILQFAHACWGVLKSISNGQDGICFTFEFESISGLSTFEKDLQKIANMAM